MLARSVRIGVLGPLVGLVAACTFGDLDSLKGTRDSGEAGASGAGASGTCPADHADCNVNPSDGCETNLLTSLTSCGGCGSACAFPHATAGCTNGTCKLVACDQGYDNCDGDDVNGCETNLRADPKNCGACKAQCPTGTASAVCSGGTCATSNCAAGTGDCDLDPAHDCEAMLNTDPKNCGYCGNACALAHATASCKAGTCVVDACDASYANCDGNDGNGCEASVSSDSKNCAACAHDCLGAACSSGKCQAITLASGLGDPTGITLDADSVYVTAENQGKVFKIAKIGGPVATLASSQPSPFGIAVDASYAYFTNRVDTGGTISRVPIAGGNVSVLVTNQARPANIAVDATHVYWTNAVGASLLSAPLGGGSATALNTAIGGILGLVIDSSNAYYSTDSNTQGEVGSVPLAGGSKTALATSLPDPRTLTSADTYLYWANYGDGTIQRLAKSGGSVSTIASGAVNPEAITVDSNNVYFADYANPGNVYRAPASGGTSETIASGQERPRRLANDATAIYWTNDVGGQVMKLAK